MKENNFENLRIWKKAHQLTLLLYELTKGFPSEERFGITSQIRRSAISVQSNIAEGYGRRTKKDFASFLHISLGSLYETQSLLKVCGDLNFLDKDKLERIDECYCVLSYMLKKFISTLKE